MMKLSASILIISVLFFINFMIIPSALVTSSIFALNVSVSSVANLIHIGNLLVSKFLQLIIQPDIARLFVNFVTPLKSQDITMLNLSKVKI